MNRHTSQFRRLLQMPRARLGLLLLAIGFPVCWYFSGVTLENETLDMLLPVAGCAMALFGASQISRCLIAVRMEEEQ